VAFMGVAPGSYRFFATDAHGRKTEKFWLIVRVGL